MFEKVEHLTRKCNKFGIMGSGTGRNEMMSRATIETVADTFMEYILYVSAKNVGAASLIDGGRGQVEIVARIAMFINKNWEFGYDCLLELSSGVPSRVFCHAFRAWVTVCPSQRPFATSLPSMCRAGIQ